MTTHIALLRGIHAAGRSRTAVLDLHAFLDAPGRLDVRALLQSGNLVFSCRGRTATELEYMLEIRAGRCAGVRTGFLIRTADDWAEIVARSPFAAGAHPGRDHCAVVVMLRDPPGRAAVQALRAAITGPETVHVDGRQLYITYGAGIGQSRLTNTVIESTLGTRAATRSWKTVIELAAVAQRAGN